MTEAQQIEKEYRSLRRVLWLYIAIFALKLGIYFVSGVLVLLAEALHTLSDIFISALLLGAIAWSRKEADREHMFGHGRAQYAAAVVAATLFLSFTSYKLFEESIPRLFAHVAHPTEYRNLGWVFGVLVASMLIAAVPVIDLLRQKSMGAAARAQLLELFNDELGLLAALAGTVCVVRGFPLGDPIATLVVAVIIAVNAVKLFWENLTYLLGRSPGAEFLDEVKRTALAVPGVLDAHKIAGEYVSPTAVHIDMHIDVRRGTPIEEAERIADEVRQRLMALSRCSYCSIHMEPSDEPAGQP